jgi:branched-chain amino acid transport system substrate-binding protein
MRTSKEPRFFITGDYAFGHSVETTARARMAELGGKVAGSVRAQLGTPHYSSFLLQAPSSGAKILAPMSPATTPRRSKAEEFGPARGMKIGPMSLRNVDIHAVGLQATRGDLILTSCFEDVSPAARRFSDAYYARRHAFADSGWSIFRRTSLSANREGRRLGRWGYRDGEDEGYACGCLYTEWPRP